MSKRINSSLPLRAEKIVRDIWRDKKISFEPSGEIRNLNHLNYSRRFFCVCADFFVPLQSRSAIDNNLLIGNYIRVDTTTERTRRIIVLTTTQTTIPLRQHCSRQKNIKINNFNNFEPTTFRGPTPSAAKETKHGVNKYINSIF